MGFSTEREDGDCAMNGTYSGTVLLITAILSEHSNPTTDLKFIRTI